MFNLRNPFPVSAIVPWTWSIPSWKGWLRTLPRGLTNYPPFARPELIPFHISHQGVRTHRLRAMSHPVLKEPMSPIAIRHRMCNWPRTAPPSLGVSLRELLPDWSSGCSTTKATCETSRGVNVGASTCSRSGRATSQLIDLDWKGVLGRKATSSSVMGPSAIFSNWASKANRWLETLGFLPSKTPSWISDTFVLTLRHGCATNWYSFLKVLTRPLDAECSLDIVVFE